MLSREEIVGLIPHAGRMCLLDGVISWDAEKVVARARSHCDPDNPLRRHTHLAALHLCEYGAQAVAVHGGLLARAAGHRARPGLLVALRDIELAVDAIDALAGELIVTARRLAGDRSSWQYAFTVHHGPMQLAAGRVAILAVGAPLATS